LLAEPPAKLNLSDKIFCQKSAKKSLIPSSILVTATPADSAPDWLKGVLSMAVMLRSGLQAGDGPPQTPPHPTPSPSTTVYPSSPLKQATSEPLSPSKVLWISAWLPALDVHPVCDQLNINYTQYVEEMTKNGLLLLNDLKGLKPEKLEVLCGMPFGTANRILKYAAEDLCPKCSQYD